MAELPAELPAARPVPLPELHYDVLFVDPRNIEAGSCVRDMREEGVSAISRSILRSGWKPGSLVLVYRVQAATAAAADPETPRGGAAQAPAHKFHGLDGMHRVMAVRALAENTEVKWPSDWPVDPETCRVRMRVGVLRKEMSQREVVEQALVLNKQTEVCVPLSQLNIYSAFEALSAALPEVPRDLPTAVGSKANKERRKAEKEREKAEKEKEKSIISIVKSRCGFTEKTVSDDYQLYKAFKKGNFLPTFLRLGKKYGHGWFTRSNLKALSTSVGVWFFLKTFEMYAELKTGRGFPVKTDTARGIFFGKMHGLVTEYYRKTKEHCARTRPAAVTKCCLSDTELIKKAVVTVSISLERWEKGDEFKAALAFIQKLCALVNKSHEKFEAPSTPKAPLRTGALDVDGAATRQEADRLLEQVTRERTPTVSQEVQESTLGESTRTDPRNEEQQSNMIELQEALPAVIRLRSAPAPVQAQDASPAQRSEIPQEAALISASPNSESFSERSVLGSVKPTGQGSSPDPKSLPQNSEAVENEGNESASSSSSDVVQPRRSKRRRIETVAFQVDVPTRAGKGRRTPRHVGPRNRDEIFAFDDDPSAHGDGESVFLPRPATAPKTIPDESAIFRIFGSRLPDMVKIKYFQGSTDIVKVRRAIKYGLLRDLGYVVLDNIFGKETTEEDAVQAACIMSRRSVDQLFQHFSLAFENETKACCSGERAVACWDKIYNDGSDMAVRFQTPREAIYQHLERSHPELFEAKLRLDLLLAVLLEELSIEDSSKNSYLIPKTGARLLLGAPGCTPQQPHTDFEVRFGEFGACAPDPSYFMVVTGADWASILAWPSSHRLVSSFDYYSSTAKGDDVIAEIERWEAIEYSAQKPQRVSIPPYSAFVGRGDLVHAGDGRDGPKPAVRAHIHCVATKDKVADNVFLRSFGTL